MDKYYIRNNAKIKPVLNRVIQRRESAGASIRDIYVLLTKKWKRSDHRSTYEFVKRYLESPSAWNRLSVNASINTVGRTNLINRMHDYMSALQMKPAEQERVFNDLAWLHEDIKYNPKKND